jgi:hypothetical protein
MIPPVAKRRARRRDVIPDVASLANLAVLPGIPRPKARERWGESMTLCVRLRGIVWAAATKIATMAAPQNTVPISLGNYDCMQGCVGPMRGLALSIVLSGGEGLMR